MNPTSAPTRTFEMELTFAGTPERVFPLLCPVVEYEWIPDWSCSVVHTKSGVAEHGCIFTTDGSGVEETWVGTTYTPPTAIEYTRLAPGRWVAMLGFVLRSASPTETSVAMTSTITALGPAGEEQMLRWTEADEHELWTLRLAQANHFLRTGTMLPLATPTA